MEHIKEAFQKVKQDMSYLENEINSVKSNISSLSSDLIETREKMIEICSVLTKMNQKLDNLAQNSEKKTNLDTPTHNTTNQTISTHISTHNSDFKARNDQFYPISIGNEGVQTDRQTNQQTNRHTESESFKAKFDHNNFNEQDFNSLPSQVENAAKMLDSLDNLKKELRLKFKRLTEQEFLVFSTIYQLEEVKGFADYKSISLQLNLTESSIRDYISRLIKKGIPVDKTKLNNKNIQLNISNNLKKIATLPTILQLRDI